MLLRKDFIYNQTEKNIIIVKNAEQTLPICSNAGIEVDKVAINLLMIIIDKS